MDVDRQIVAVYFVPVKRNKTFFLKNLEKTVILKNNKLNYGFEMLTKNETLIKIIQSVEGVFANSEKVIFIELLKLSIDDQVVVTAHFLKKATSLSFTAIYTTLKSLQLKHYIKKIQKDTYEISFKNTEYLKELYQVQNKYTNVE